MSRRPDCALGAFAQAVKTVRAYIGSSGISDVLSGGVLLALSGGADSVFLLHVLAGLADEEHFSLLAVHVNHHLRGAESDRDADFCRSLCGSLDIPFECVDVDVAAERRNGRFGVEEAARRVRYRALHGVLAEHPELSCIATAHHATDQLETVVFQMLRGGGLRAVVGMTPVRLPLVRPLLCMSRREIEAALSETGISFVTDTTNADVGYTRNYLRREILPRLLRVNREPERAVFRMSEALSHDVSLLDDLARAARQAAPVCGDGVDAAYLVSLHEAMRRRVLVMLYEEQRSADAAHIPIEHTHIVSVSRLLCSGRSSFSYAVPNRLFAVLRDGVFSFRRAPISEMVEGTPVPLPEGDNALPGGFVLNVRREGTALFLRCSSFFHKIDIGIAISSDIINGELYARTRMPQDSYRFRGHTHSLKKMYNEAKIPLAVRPYLPIVCDQSGILWVPFFPIRENLRED